MADTGCIYGDSGTYKSTACKHFSHYIYEVTGKKTLLISMDGGGWVPMRPEIEAGVIVPYRSNNQFPLPVLRKISQGYFPDDPTQTEISKTVLRRVDWSQFGGMIIEGLSSISQVLMRHLADTARKTGEDATSAFGQKVIVVNDDGKAQMVEEIFAGNSRGHYGFVQSQLYSMVTNFSSLPCRYVLFTALESRTEEDDRSTIYGPQVAGKKATALVPTWIGDCLHSQSYPVEKTITVPDPATGKPVDSKIIDVVVRTHFTKHPDPSTGIMFPAKPRVTPEQVAALWKEYPGGYFQPTPEGGFDKYLHMIDKLSSSQAQNVAEWRKKVDERFGRGAAATAAAASPTPTPSPTPAKEPAK